MIGHIAFSPVTMSDGTPDWYGLGPVSGLRVGGVPSEVFFALSFDGRHPQGSVVFHEAFKAGGSPGP